ncbi:MAG: ABC transporter ATP-binding protein [Dolichospermum sp.]
MLDTVIRVENLGKKYTIRHQKRERYTALRDIITNKFKSISSFINSEAKTENSAFEEFWALKDIFLEIKQGDRVGIIGRNGAGKSTLLKILSRITQPTTGSIKIKGRVASLLEVGTGFHPELTGRENIFLNGAILGMGKMEIKQKFDEIVAFAEVEKFLDTPVKRYSSGMYVRLAFAVAAHLEPEILIVDEVLAVGDAAFQKKCLGKMEDVSKSEGRTVLFVSHNIAAIKRFCQTGIFLEKGNLKVCGDINHVTSHYEQDTFLDSKETKNKNNIFPLTNQKHRLSLENINTTVEMKDDHAHLLIELQIKSFESYINVGIGISVQTFDGLQVCKLGPKLTRNVIEKIDGNYGYLLKVENIEKYLSSGEYLISVNLFIPGAGNVIKAENISRFKVPIFDIYDSGIPCENSKHGIVPLPIKLVKI